MANTYTWKIDPEGLVTISELDNKVDVIKTINFIVTGTDGVNTVELPGSTELEYNPNNPFVEFNNLTEEKLISWAKEHNPVKTVAIEKAIDTILAKKTNPGPVISAKKAPWAA